MDTIRSTAPGLLGPQLKDEFGDGASSGEMRRSSARETGEWSSVPVSPNVPGPMAGENETSQDSLLRPDVSGSDTAQKQHVRRRSMSESGMLRNDTPNGLAPPSDYAPSKSLSKVAEFVTDTKEAKDSRPQTARQLNSTTTKVSANDRSSKAPTSQPKKGQSTPPRSTSNGALSKILANGTSQLAPASQSSVANGKPASTTKSAHIARPIVSAPAAVRSAHTSQEDLTAQANTRLEAEEAAEQYDAVDDQESAASQTEPTSCQCNAVSDHTDPAIIDVSLHALMPNVFECLFGENSVFMSSFPGGKQKAD